MHEHASTRPQPLSLPTPGPCKAYHCDCAEYRPIPGGGPADNPASHWGKVVHAGNHQVNDNHDEHVPSGEQRAPPSMGWHAHCTPTNLARALLLCGFLFPGPSRARGAPRVTSCTTSPGARCPLLTGAMARAGCSIKSMELATLAVILLIAGLLERA